MRKVQATDQSSAEEAAAKAPPPADGSDGCPSIWKYRVSNVRGVKLGVTEGSFVFLHPQSPLALLFEATLTYLA